jgi:hypothetical protein
MDTSAKIEEPIKEVDTEWVGEFNRRTTVSLPSGFYLAITTIVRKEVQRDGKIKFFIG